MEYKRQTQLLAKELRLSFRQSYGLLPDLPAGLSAQPLFQMLPSDKDTLYQRITTS